MIQALDLSRKYGAFLALQNVSFQVKEGEVVGLLGQNGAGKSTLMNVLSGCLAPSQGQVMISGIDLCTKPLQAKRKLGYLPENPPLYPELTVRESLDFCCRLMGVLPKDIKKHVHEILTLTDTVRVEHQLCKNLSRGFRQRVGLGQALCGDPEVLLLDEPTAGFDPSQAKSFRKLIKNLSSSKAILLSTHLMAEVQAMCDRVLILHQGELLLDQAMVEEQAVQRFQLVISSADATIAQHLQQMKGVLKVKRMSAHGKSPLKLLIEAEASCHFQQPLQAFLAKNQLTLLELTPLLDTLEHLFLQTIGLEDQEL